VKLSYVVAYALQDAGAGKHKHAIDVIKFCTGLVVWRHHPFQFDHRFRGCEGSRGRIPHFYTELCLSSLKHSGSASVWLKLDDNCISNCDAGITIQVSQNLISFLFVLIDYNSFNWFGISTQW